VLLQLNYIAVIKSCKKRNRQLAEGLAPTPVPPTRAVELLSQQYFFTSPKLAALTTEAEIISKVRVRCQSHLSASCMPSRESRACVHPSSL